jgi:hypothetical protein
MKLENPLEPLLNSSALSPAIMQSMYANPDKVFIWAYLLTPFGARRISRVGLGTGEWRKTNDR